MPATLSPDRSPHFIDFIKEERTPIGDFEDTQLLRIGAGKGTLLVAEEFVFECLSEQRGTLIAIKSRDTRGLS